MKVRIEWTERHYYSEEVDAPDTLNDEELDDWVAENFLEVAWADGSPQHTSTSDIEWHKA